MFFYFSLLEPVDDIFPKSQKNNTVRIQNVLVLIENESMFICQNTDWFQFCHSNMAINAVKLRCYSKPVKAHLLVCRDVNRLGSISMISLVEFNHLMKFGLWVVTVRK